MSELLRMDEEYRKWIAELSQRYRASQIKASVRVNNEMLMYYWSVGRDIADRHADSKWGNKFFQAMSTDMSDMIPNVKGFSPRNLRYMMKFYELFSNVEIVPQLGAQLLEGLESPILPQPDAKLPSVYSGEICGRHIKRADWHIGIRAECSDAEGL